MGLLTRLERAVETCETALLGKVFPSEPIELLRALRRECDDHAVVVSEHRVLVPNAYRVELEAGVHERLRACEGKVSQELTDVLVRHAAENGYDFPGPVAVHLGRSEDLPNGRYRVSSTAAENIPAGVFETAR